ncbi:MAG TPA: hypothetical protein VGN74_12185 [Brevundimonas sp.]|jgi:hypothetical protein|uniref:hypothetical protein n=1 Tax=Brevundimonas sp. TaxID=1871086 RepID=UPI002E136A78|nr:hypothetical protein [Brevundimonas sp.]
MKTVLSLAAAAAAVLSLSACATTPRTDLPYAADATEFTGWLKLSGEEFELYAREEQVLRPFARPCVSGAASLDEMRALGDLAGARVRITGRTAAWSSDLPGNRLVHERATIRNTCGGAFVILADDIEAIL